ncbi:MAG TPA: hypothetical protein VJU87_00300 [Gemmatimonadaceae bacterium]|nr:hypothetical protein [Gemmatimonadaceae bacterium]
MRVSALIRRVATLAAVALAAGACSDTPSAPAPQAAARQAVQQGQAPAFYTNALQSRSQDHGKPLKFQTNDNSGETDITVDPQASRTYAFGDNWVYFPAHAICDPATSGYGPAYWDAPCTPLNRPFTIHVKWSPEGGHSFVEFSPDLRFAPSNNRFQWVILSLRDQQDLRGSDYNILYNPTGDEDGLWVNEAAADPTLRPHIDYAQKTVYRRVKHFSGYMLSAGFTALDGGFSDAY